MRSRSGYTLVEIMIALFIFTLVAMAASKGLHTVMTSQSATESKAAELRDLQMALLLFSRDLSQALDASPPGKERKVEGSFSGKAQELKWMSLLIGGESNRLVEHHYTFKDQQWWREQRSLLKGLSALQYRYLDNKKQFHTQWPPKGENEGLSRLPQAVELTLTYKDQRQIKQLYLLPQQEVPHGL